MEEFLNDLGITKEGNYTEEDGIYVVDIDDSNEYGKIFSLLEKSNLLEQDELSSQVTEDTSSIQYINDKYVLTLLGDWDGDTYKLTVKEK